MSKVVHVEIKPKHPDEPIERMIRRFTKKVKKEGVIAKVLENRYYDKPSVKRKKEEKRRKKALDKLRKVQRAKEGR